MRTSLLVAHRDPPVAGTLGGSDRRMALLLAALRAAGTRPTVAYPVWPSSPPLDAAGLETVQAALGPHELVTFPAAPQAQPRSFKHYYLEPMLRPEAVPDLGQYCGPAALARLRELMAGRDLVVGFGLQSALPVLRAGGAPRLVYDINDIYHVLLRRQVLAPPRWPGKYLKLLALPAVRTVTARIGRAAALTLVCSEEDRRRLAGLIPRLAVVENAVRLPPAPVTPTDAPTLLFLGQMHYPPNREGAIRLATRILPRVRAELPQARALIAGAWSDELAGWMKPLPDGVDLLGFVPDLAALYARSAIATAPLDVGGGTRVKLVEAAGYGVPSVSTRIGAEGLTFVPEREILLADDDASFAAACVRLLRDRAEAARLGRAARARAEAEYGFDAVAGRLAARLEPLLAATPDGAAAAA